MKKKSSLIRVNSIGNLIFFLRGQQVIWDADLARLYGVETKYLKRQVNRNNEYFPSDFMFSLTGEEIEILRCQFGTSSWGGSRYRSFVLTEEGVAMLSSILKSRRAVLMNIRIMRAFVRFKEFLHKHQEIVQRLEKLERQFEQHDGEIRAILNAIRQLMNSPGPPKHRIGFHSQ